MVIITFKTLIPKPVREWIQNRGYVEDFILEVEMRLNRKLSTANEFREYGKILKVYYDESKNMVADCSIKIDANNEEEARRKFSSIFGSMSKKGQKFKYLSFVYID